jgi:hypothetical protein
MDYVTELGSLAVELKLSSHIALFTVHSKDC